jgi:hypothetical protein
MPMTIAKNDRTIGAWCFEWNAKLEQAEYSLKLAQGACETGYNSSVLAGNPLNDFNKIADPIMATRSVISAMRAIPMVVELFTGRLFFETNNKGELTKSHSWKLIALKVSLLIGRVLIPFLFFHALGVIDLGLHAQWMGLTCITAFTLVCTISFISDLDDYIKQKEKILTGNLGDQTPDEAKAKLKSISWGLSVSVGDLISMPWDNGIVNLTDPVAGVVRGVASVIGGGIFMTRQLVADR